MESETMFKGIYGYVIVYSEDDGGYYGDVWYKMGGNDAHQTAIFKSNAGAESATLLWINSQSSGGESDPVLHESTRGKACLETDDWSS